MLRKAVMLLICLLCSPDLWAAEGPLQSAPIYNPATKSYFQLFNDDLHPSWEGVRAQAESKVFKGVRGRLAVVDTLEKHKFVLQNFHFNWHEASVWIGLRYWCSVRMLQWEDGLPYSPSDADHFRLWHSRWARSESAGSVADPCGMDASLRQGFAPVYYRNIGGVVRWQAVGAGKGFSNFLVEFVTNGE